ncbi:hypothetical protein KY358_02515 [Candidatus Woesearchaeota archaeon]|nr:hypothetical protein [Candidatus Woesearchaeota archaeon]
MKCSICGKKIEKTFLGKIMGTYMGKKPVCSECQKKPGAKEGVGQEKAEETTKEEP